MSGDALKSRVQRIVGATPVFDLHTHLFTPGFDEGGPQRFLLWGIDSLLTYHYLQAEFFRVEPDVSPEAFLASPIEQQADTIWRALFIDRTPISEACRGVVTTLTRLGIDPHETTLDGYRSWFSAQRASTLVDRVMEVSGVEHIVMTNEVFDESEHRLWIERPGTLRDPRFSAVLRVDTLLCDRPRACAALSRWGYGVDEDLGGGSLGEIRRFLREWIERTDAVYVATSLPPEFCYPAGDAWQGRVIDEALMPELAERGLAWAMMVGSRRGVNARLGPAGDSLGDADVGSIERLCDRFPQNRFLATVLSRESQHSLAVASRKFSNLMPFGCWWFVNTPSLITEITRMRLELLGSSFVPQHSDARVLEQLIYKWDHSRACIADALSTQYAGLSASGFTVTDRMIEEDARRLLSGNAAASVGTGDAHRGETTR